MTETDQPKRRRLRRLDRMDWAPPLKLAGVVLFGVTTLLLLRFHDSIGGFLKAQTNHGLWESLGAIGSFALGIVALIGGWVALRSYRTTTRTNATAQMHAIFREYLNKRSALLLAEFQASMDPRFAAIGEAPSILALASNGRSVRDSLKADLAGYLLYTLEEMFAWIENERQLLANESFFVGKAERKHRCDLISAWKATIVTHLLQERTQAADSMKEYAGCYSRKFIEFANSHLHDPRIAELLERSGDRVGTVEQRQHDEADIRKAALEALVLGKA